MLPTSIYPNELPVKDALQVYFSHYHFKDGGYNDKYFKIKSGPFFIPVPNIKDRVDAVKIHDINHLITGYSARYRGEAQIGGWEIATGCGRYYAAWILNFGSFIIGLAAFPKALYMAFMQGRLLQRSLYRNVIYDEKLLNTTLGELRGWLQEDAKKKNDFGDLLLFIFYSLVSMLYLLPLIVLLVLFC